MQPTGPTSLPWDHPDSDPLKDIQEFASKAREEGWPPKPFEVVLPLEDEQQQEP